MEMSRHSIIFGLEYHLTGPKISRFVRNLPFFERGFDPKLETAVAKGSENKVTDMTSFLPILLLFMKSRSVLGHTQVINVVHHSRSNA